MTTERPLTIALVGAGANIAEQHLLAIEACPGVVLTAACDLDRGAAERIAATTGATAYADVEGMLRSARPDIVAVLTPHPSHAYLAAASLAAGAHVLVEKPMAVSTSEADAMIEAATLASRLLAVSFQHRFSPMTERLHTLATSGEVGEVLRVEVREPWLRTAAYFSRARWRATWRGEGGGVLLNQAPHALDLLCHLMGLPSRVTGMTRTQRHAIECEDCAHALLEWESGAIGYFSSSTNEPETGRRLELVGDRAKIVVDGSTLRRIDIVPGLREHAATSTEPFGHPSYHEHPVEELAAGATHAPVYADLVAAIRRGTTPRCDGQSGRMSLEVANAIALSSWTDRPVDLPLDRDAYDAHLALRRDPPAD